MRTAALCVASWILAVHLSHAGEARRPDKPGGANGGPSRALTLDQLWAILAAPDTTSVDVLVGKLPQVYRENYVEVFSSRSPENEGVSPGAPRIIAFGDDARVIISYFGDPTHREIFNRVLICAFNDAARSWEFYQTSVPALKEAGGGLKPLGKNPVSCLGCHGKGSDRPSPIWDAYPLWPGVFGGDDEMLFHGLSTGSKEAKLRAQFLANKGSLGRYRLLRERGRAPAVDDPRPSPDPLDMPNTAFGVLLNLRQAEAMARAFRDDPRLQPYRFAILAAVTGRYVFRYPFVGVGMQFPPKDPRLAGLDKVDFSYPLFPFLPPAFPGPGKPSPRDFLGHLLGLDKQSMAMRLQRHLSLLDITRPESPRLAGYLKEGLPFDSRPLLHEVLSRIMFISENVGVPVRSWSLDLDTLLQNHDGMNAFVNHLEPSLWSEWVDEKFDPELFRIFSKAARRRPSPVDPLLWGGKDVLSFDELVREMAVRRLVCERLLVRSRESLNLAPFPMGAHEGP